MPHDPRGRTAGGVMGQATNTLRGEDEMVSGQFRKRRHDTPLFIR